MTLYAVVEIQLQCLSLSCKFYNEGFLKIRLFRCFCVSVQSLPWTYFLYCLVPVLLWKLVLERSAILKIFFNVTPITLHYNSQACIYLWYILLSCTTCILNFYDRKNKHADKKFAQIYFFFYLKENCNILFNDNHSWYSLVGPSMWRQHRDCGTAVDPLS